MQTGDLWVLGQTRLLWVGSGHEMPKNLAGVLVAPLVTGSPENRSTRRETREVQEGGGESHETDQHTPEQVIRKLREVERMLAQGKELSRTWV